MMYETGEVSDWQLEKTIYRLMSIPPKESDASPDRLSPWLLACHLERDKGQS